MKDSSTRPVPGFDDYTVTVGGVIRGPAGCVMRMATMPSGHLYVLCNRGLAGQHKLFVHRAVLLAFVGEPSPGQECRHLDGDPTNNRLDNLCWGTRSENMQDRVRHGDCGPRHRCAKLDIPQLIAILAGEGRASSRVVAHEFGVSHTTIQRVWRGYGRAWV